METKNVFKHLNIADLLLEDEYDPDYAVIQGAGALILTEHDFVHWIERGETVDIEIHSTHTLDSRLVTLGREELLARLGKEVDIPEWGHYFGIKSRVHTNYHLLLHSMKELGLATDQMPDWNSR